MRPILTADLLLEHDRIPNDATTELRVALRIQAQGQAVERSRAPLAVVFALDVSSSMSGEPISSVIHSVDKLLALLTPDDAVGVVSFSNDAQVVHPLVPATAAHLSQLSRQVRHLRASGSTAMEAGLRLSQTSLALGPARKVVLVLSDGQPNIGASTSEALGALAASGRPGISVSSLGFGAHHSEDILQAIARGGGGNYHFIRQPRLSLHEFARALGAQADVVADGLELELQPTPGAEVLRFSPECATRFGAYGPVLSLPDLRENGVLRLVLRLRLSPGREGRRWIPLTMRLRYRHAGQATVQTETLTLALDIGQALGPKADSALAEIWMVEADAAREAARAHADQNNFAMAAGVLEQLINEIRNATVLVESHPLLADALEQLQDDLAMMQRRPDQESLAAFKRGQAAHMAAPMDKGSATRAALSHAAGKFPPARLVALNGPKAGASLPLEADNSLGRTSTADVVLPSSQVSRRHAQIFAVEGEFWIADLGSSNPTMVNGQVIKTQLLKSGDELQLGDLRFRYEERS